MAATGTATFTCTVSGLATGSKTVAPPQVALSAAVGQVSDSSLAAADNTITVPTGSTFAVLAFPVTTAVVKLKKAGGDAGVTILNNPSVPLFCPLLVLGETSFILNSTVIINGFEVSFL